MNQQSRIRQRKLRAVKPSKQAEVYYRKQLISLVDLMQSLVVNELQDNTLNDALFSKGVSLLAKQMDRALNKLESLDINNIATMMARGFIRRLNQNNENSLKSNLKNTTGLMLEGNIVPEGLQDALGVVVSQNVALIKSIKDEYKESVGKLLRDQVLEGDRPTNLVTQVKDIGGVTKSRAKFIARDQTAKVNADVTQLRAEALGSKTYIWSSTNDERSRPDHDALDGLLCKWDDPTVVSKDNGKTWISRRSIGAVELHPGKSYNCRCVSLAQISFS